MSADVRRVTDVMLENRFIITDPIRSVIVSRGKLLRPSKKARRHKEASGAIVDLGIKIETSETPLFRRQFKMALRSEGVSRRQCRFCYLDPPFNSNGFDKLGMFRYKK